MDGYIQYTSSNNFTLYMIMIIYKIYKSYTYMKLYTHALPLLV